MSAKDKRKKYRDAIANQSAQKAVRSQPKAFNRGVDAIGVSGGGALFSRKATNAAIHPTASIFSLEADGVRRQAFTRIRRTQPLIPLPRRYSVSLPDRFPWIGWVGASVDAMYNPNAQYSFSPSAGFIQSDYHLDKFTFSPTEEPENPFYSTAVNANGDSEWIQYDNGIPTPLRAVSLPAGSKYVGGTGVYAGPVLSPPYGAFEYYLTSTGGSSGFTNPSTGLQSVDVPIGPGHTANVANGSGTFVFGTDVPQPTGANLFNGTWGVNLNDCGFDSNGIQLRALAYNRQEYRYRNYSYDADVLLTGQNASIYRTLVEGEFDREFALQSSSAVLGTQVQSSNGTSNQYFYVWRQVGITKSSGTYTNFVNPQKDWDYSFSTTDQALQVVNVPISSVSPKNLEVSDPGANLNIGDTFTVVVNSGFGAARQERYTVQNRADDQSMSATYSPIPLPGGINDSALDLGDIQNTVGVGNWIAYDPPLDPGGACDNGFDPNINVNGFSFGFATSSVDAITTYQFIFDEDRRRVSFRFRKMILVSPTGKRYWVDCLENSATVNGTPGSELAPIDDSATYTWDGATLELQVTAIEDVDWDSNAGEIADMASAILYGENDIGSHMLDPDLDILLAIGTPGDIDGGGGEN